MEPEEIFSIQLVLGSQTGRSPAPTLPWEQWASLSYTSLAGGRGSCGYQEHICDVNNSTCRAYINSFYSTIYISYVWFSTSTDNMTLLTKFSTSTVSMQQQQSQHISYEYVFLRFSTVCHSVIASYVLQTYCSAFLLNLHFREHFLISTPPHSWYIQIYFWMTN